MMYTYIYIYIYMFEIETLESRWNKHIKHGWKKAVLGSATKLQQAF